MRSCFNDNVYILHERISTWAWSPQQAAACRKTAWLCTQFMKGEMGDFQPISQWRENEAERAGGAYVEAAVRRGRPKLGENLLTVNSRNDSSTRSTSGLSGETISLVLMAEATGDYVRKWALECGPFTCDILNRISVSFIYSSSSSLFPGQSSGGAEADLGNTGHGVDIHPSWETCPCIIIRGNLAIQWEETSEPRENL